MKTFGAYIKGYGVPDPPWDMRAVADFQSKIGRPIGMLHYGTCWADTGASWTTKYGGYQPFNGKLMDTLLANDIKPALDWGSYDMKFGANFADPRFSLQSILSGVHDDLYLKPFAAAAREYGKEFFLRWNWEMNGSWYAWGKTPELYAKAWRHIYEIFRQAHATNVKFVWCPNVIFDHSTDLAMLYPGSDFVDVVAMDGYNWGSLQGTWKGFYSVFYPTYKALQAYGKPIQIFEFGCNENNDGGVLKARWLTDAFEKQLPINFPKVEAAMYFNRNMEQALWEIDTTPLALEAVHEALKIAA